MSVEIEKRMILSKRKIVDVGDSKAVTLPKKWLEFQKWLGEEVNEVALLVADNVVVLVPPGKEEKAKKILLELEREVQSVLEH